MADAALAYVAESATTATSGDFLGVFWEGFWGFGLVLEVVWGLEVIWGLEVVLALVASGELWAAWDPRPAGCTRLSSSVIGRADSESVGRADSESVGKADSESVGKADSESEL